MQVPTTMLRNVFDLSGRANWGERYRELVAYRDQHGDCCVPKAQGKLGRWVARQREQKKKRMLRPDREAKLNALGFVWNTNDSAWETKFTQLNDWRERNGHACVPIAEGDLGLWVAKQRQMKRKEKLAEHREKLLDSIGFVWDTPTTDWNEKYQALVRWKELYGDCRVPFNEGDLGWWVNTQRQSKRKGKLSAEREERLNAIGFIWNPQGVTPASSTQAGPSSATPQQASHVRRISSGSAGSKRKSEDRYNLHGSSSKRHHSFSSSDSGQFGSYGFLPPSTGQCGSHGGFIASSSNYGHHRSFYPPPASGSSSQSSAMSYDREEQFTHRDSDAGYSSGALHAPTPPVRSETQSPMSGASVTCDPFTPFLPPIRLSDDRLSEKSKASAASLSLQRPAVAYGIDIQHAQKKRNQNLLPSASGLAHAEHSIATADATAATGTPRGIAPFASADGERSTGLSSALDRFSPFEKLPPLHSLGALSLPNAHTHTTTGTSSQALPQPPRTPFGAANNTATTAGTTSGTASNRRPGSSIASLLQSTDDDEEEEEVNIRKSCRKNEDAKSPRGSLGLLLNSSRTRVASLCSPEPDENVKRTQEDRAQTALAPATANICTDAPTAETGRAALFANYTGTDLARLADGCETRAREPYDFTARNGNGNGDARTSTGNGNGNGNENRKLP